MYKHLDNGGFVIRRSGKIKFNSVSMDQSLEQTISQEAKGKGGVFGFTLRKSALLRWLLTRHIVANIQLLSNQWHHLKKKLNTILTLAHLKMLATIATSSRFWMDVLISLRVHLTWRVSLQV